MGVYLPGELQQAGRGWGVHLPGELQQAPSRARMSRGGSRFWSTGGTPSENTAEMGMTRVSGGTINWIGQSTQGGDSIIGGLFSFS